MLAIHADQMFVIGTVAETPQPIVVSSKQMRNVPEDAIWSWDPGAHFGVLSRPTSSSSRQTSPATPSRPTPRRPWRRADHMLRFLS